MKITTVLFDLDGTLTDSGPGIMNSVKYALEKVGEPTPDVDELRKFIGPPLKGQFMEHCGIDEEKAAEMVTLYREYFTVTGIFENSVYDGVEEMLKTLKQAGIKIAMATSKPEKFAKIIADHFGLAQYFDVIGGACMDETRTEKQDVRAESDRCSVWIRRLKRTLRGRCRRSGNNTTGSGRIGSGKRIK